MSTYEHHVFICLNQRDESDARGCCASKEGAAVHAWFKAQGTARDWKGRIRVNKAGCLDQCAFGPTVVVYPEGVWYSPQSEDEVRQICEEHLEGGVVVDALLIPGLN